MKQDGFTSKDVLDLLVLLIVLVLVMTFLRVFVVGAYRIPSGSMEGTIEIGDRVITNRLAPKIVPLKRGDIIVFKDPANWLGSSDGLESHDLIKRLIGLPGDIVACEGKGKPVTVNGVAIDEKAYTRKGVSPSDFSFRVKVTQGNVFVMGDNRSNSADSRYHQDDGNHGLVPISRVRGIAFLTLSPIRHIGVLRSHHEVFDSVPGAAHS
jgi:signal peptidase I